MFSPWSTCQFNHCGHLSPSYVALVNPTVKSTIDSKLASTLTSQSSTPQHPTDTKNYFHSKSANSAKLPTPVKPRSDKDKQKNRVQVPSDWSYRSIYNKDVQYKFTHSTVWSDHMKQYRLGIDLNIQTVL